MTSPRIVVLDGYTVNPGDASWEPLAELGELVVYDRTPRTEVLERSRGAHILVTNKAVLDARTIGEIPELRAICVMATGYNVVDVEAARKRRIPICNVPAYSTASVVEHTLALLLALCRRIELHDAAVHEGEWTNSIDFAFWKTPQVELHGRVLGIVGHGTIGSAVARVALALGMQVVATPSRSTPPAAGVRIAELDSLFSESDVVSLHCPLTPETRELVRWERLVRMRPSAFLINTARGGLVRETDLARALHEGILAGAALDVLSEEPPSAENPLLHAPRCLITPHLAWTTLEARRRVVAITADNIRAILAGQPIHVVNA